MEFISKDIAEISDYLHKELAERIIQIFYEVYNTLGWGFVENVYQNAMCFALKDAGIECKAQKKIAVYFHGHRVGDYKADIVVEDKIILELKAVSELCEAHVRQLSNYLKATRIELGLLLNFGETPQLRRWIYTNDQK